MMTRNKVGMVTQSSSDQLATITVDDTPPQVSTLLIRGMVRWIPENYCIDNCLVFRLCILDISIIVTLK